VIAFKYEYPYPGAFQTRDLAVEEQANGGVLPISVVYVSGNNHERDVCVDCARDQIRKRVAASLRKALSNFLISQGQPNEGAPKMEVSGMKKRKFHQVDCARISCE
jgi:hypothetical protein